MEQSKETLEEMVKRVVREMIPQPVEKEKEEVVYEPKPYRPGKFIHDSIGEDKEEIYCPTCGTFERRTVPVKKVVETKEVLPKGYVPQPKSLEDVIPYLEIKHQDGKSIFECANCSTALSGWIDKHTDELKRLGYEVRKARR